jgi:hypothetical protein
MGLNVADVRLSKLLRAGLEIHQTNSSGKKQGNVAEIENSGMLQQLDYL